MRIPLPKIMRHWRMREFEARLTPLPARAGLGLWARVATRPALYRLLTGIGVRLLGALGRRRGRFRRLPLAAGWTTYRDLPAPQGSTFQALWAARQRQAGGRR